MDDEDSCKTREQLLEDLCELRASARAALARCALSQAVTEVVPDAVYAKDAQGRYTLVNTACARVFGMSAEEAIGKDDTELFAPDDARRIMQIDRQIMATGTTITFEQTVSSAKPMRTYLTTKGPFRDDRGGVAGVLGFARDITAQKQAERDLRDRHNLLHAVIEGIADAIYVKDLDGRYVMVNSKGAHLIGRTAQEVIGRDDTFLFNAETAQRIREIDRRVLENEEITTEELAATAAGITRIWLTSKVPFRDADGKVIGVLGISRDITESKALQTERDRLLERLRLQIDRLPLAYILLDENHRVTDWNPAAETMFGYTKAEVLGQHAVDLIVRQPMDNELVEVIRRIESGDMQADSVNENRTKDGRAITCHWFNTPLVDPDGNFAGVISVAEDITERTRAEEEVRVLNAALEDAVDGIGRLDAEGRYSSVNRAFADFLGFRAEELVGRHWFSTVHPIDLEKAKSAYERMLNDGKAEVELLRPRKDGSTFWTQTVIVKAYDHRPNWIGHYSFMKDISERKEAEEALRRSAERLQVLSRRVVEVQEQERRHVARELHDEIGQVLSAVGVNLRGLKVTSSAAASPRIEESIQIVEQAVEQVRNLSLELRPYMLDDLGLAATLRWLVDRQAQRSGLVPHFAVESSSAPLPPSLATACFRVAQGALTNVVRHAHARNVWVELQQGDEQVRLLIRDDGVGFDLEAARLRAREGVAFGLLAIQERVALLGGRTTVESQPSHGASVCVWFPLTATLAPDEPNEEGQQ